MGGRAWLGRVALVATGLSVLTRLPGLVSGRLFNVDEAYLAAMGVTMGRGGSLYVDVVDRKPPVLPWLYSVSETLFGTVDLRFMRLLVVVAVAGTGVVVAALAVRLGASRHGGMAAAALLVLGTAAFPPADGQAANFEVYALLPASAAVLAVVAARGGDRGRRLALFAAAGVLVGVAGMIKQPFLVMLAPVGWEAWRGSRRLADRVVDGVSALVGAGVAMVLIGLPFGLGGVYRWGWRDTGDYLDGQVGGLRILAVFVVVTALFALLHLPALATFWIGRRRLASVDRVLWVWGVAAVIAVVPGFRFIVHYFQLVVPPLAVVAGVLLTGASATARRWVLGTTAAIAGACVVIAALPSADVGRVPPDLVAAVQEHAGPDDRVLVWGALPELFWRTERLPGVRFLSVGYVNGKWADRQHPPPDPEQNPPYKERWPIFNKDLREHLPTVVVDMTTSHLDEWTEYAPDRYAFGRVLHECYKPVGVAAEMEIWELADAACVERLAR